MFKTEIYAKLTLFNNNILRRMCKGEMYITSFDLKALNWRVIPLFAVLPVFGKQNVHVGSYLCWPVKRKTVSAIVRVR